MGFVLLYIGVDCFKNGRNYQAIPDDHAHYNDVDAGVKNMPCPTGTKFDLTSCECVYGGVGTTGKYCVLLSICKNITFSQNISILETSMHKYGL